jgi:hypothetical protein
VHECDIAIAPKTPAPRKAPPPRKPARPARLPQGRWLGDLGRLSASELIRFLALGGDALHPVHEEGVMLRGAWITGLLDVHQCKLPLRLVLNNCHFIAIVSRLVKVD